jgi:SAM-dependent methyltransferase
MEGRPYGGWYDPSQDPRVEFLFRCFPGTRRILELGSLEGAHTLALARHPGVQSVVGIEGRADNVRRAEFLRRQLSLANVRFHQARVEEIDFLSLGSFDAALCVGLLYHLAHPWELLRRLSQVAPRLLLSTHYAEESQAHERCQGYQGRTCSDFALDGSYSGLAAEAFWPTRESLGAMLDDAGYGRIEVCHNDPQHQHGPLITLAAQVGRGVCGHDEQSRVHSLGPSPGDDFAHPAITA